MVLNAFEDLVEVLQAAHKDKRHGSSDLLWKSLQRMGQHAAGPYQEADISFHAMLLFCAVVPVDMRLQVSLVLDDCFRQADPQVYLNSETNACKLSQYAGCLVHTLTCCMLFSSMSQVWEH